MDYYQMRLMAYGLISVMIALAGILLIDGVLKSRLPLGKRLTVYAGLALILCGYSLFDVRLHKYREWYVIKSAAEYHDVSMYHAAKRAARREAEKKNVKDADRSTGVAPVYPSSGKCPGS